MSKRGYILLLLFILATHVAYSQTYFQQDVKYTIDVKLDDSLHYLNAKETIVYTNNSPDTLKFIYFHLWPNAYRTSNSHLGRQMLLEGNTKLYWSDYSERGSITGLDFTLNGSKANWRVFEDTVDVCIVYLNSPLVPGASINIATPFKVKIPDGNISRLGHLGQQYQITQWYPKPAVYDNKGWHAMPYLNQGEFYSEFGTYDVFISLPKNYVLGATGDRVDAAEEEQFMEDKFSQTKAIVDFSTSMKFPPSDKTFKTIHFHQERVHDFAWFADKRYHVLKGEVELPFTKRKVTTWTMFTNENANTWLKSIEYINNAVYYYSLWNGEYPYNHCTAVDGSISAGGGMEYPNITVIGATEDPYDLDIVIAHEVGHNWFYGILGSNERDYAWMDEGINSFNEMRYIRTRYPQRKLADLFLKGFWERAFDMGHFMQDEQYDLAYIACAREHSDQSLSLSSTDFTTINYGTIVYMKTAGCFDYLRAYLGDAMFDTCMHAYYSQWRYKHPHPIDIRNVFESITKRNLSWMFDDLLGTTKKLDYKIVDARTVDYKNYVLIKNVGDINGPVNITGMIKGKMRAEVWFDGFEGEQWLPFPPGNFDAYKIDYMLNMPEVNRSNNTINSKQTFRKFEPLRLQFLGSLENPNKTHLYFSPVIGFNTSDRAMAGLAFYNDIIPAKKWSYIAMPLYSSASKELTGFAELKRKFYFDNAVIKQLNIGGTVKSYHYNDLSAFYYDLMRYTKITGDLDFYFKKSNANSKINKSIKFQYISIKEDAPHIDFSKFTYEILEQYNSFEKIDYLFENTQRINPYSIKLSATHGSQFLLRTSVEAKYEISYQKKNKAIKFRLFAGKIFNGNTTYFSTPSDMFSFYMNGTNDYLYEHTVIDRRRNMATFRNQTVLSESGFRNITDRGAADNWLSALNTTVSLPFLPVAYYLDLGMDDKSSNLAMNMGLSFIVIPEIFEIYFPLKSNSNLNMLNYSQKIGLLLNINMMNPFPKIRNFSSLI